MNKSFLEIFTGLIVVVFCGYFLISSYSKAELKKDNKGYNVTAKFSNIDGINIGSEIRIAGIKVGEVINRTIDPKTYQAVITLNINENVKVPVDSSAEIASEGFLGGKFVSIKAGADDEFLKDNSQIQYTQSSVSLETLIGKMIFSKDNDNKKDTKQEKSAE